MSEALPAPVFAEAVMDDSAAVTSAAEHPAMIIDAAARQAAQHLPRGHRRLWSLPR